LQRVSYQYGQREVQQALLEADEVGKQVVVVCPSGTGLSPGFLCDSHNIRSIVCNHDEPQHCASTGQCFLDENFNVYFKASE